MIQELDPSEAARKLQEGARLIDVRSHAEVAQARLPGAEHVPMHLIPMMAGQFGRETPIVFYCRSGARSAQVCYFLAQQGFSNAINLRGGIISWAQQGMEIDYAPLN